MSRWLANLNPEQREAVSTLEGPLLVLAGAGSGKTRVITHRVAHLMERGVAGANVLAVTFTNKAADEMKQRLRRMVGGAAADVTVTTFHSLGLQILRSEVARTRRGARVTVFDTGDQVSLLKQLTRQLQFDRAFDLGSILARISVYKNRFSAPGEVAVGDDPYDEAAALLYPRYQEALEAYAAVDFDDLVCRPSAMLRDDDACRLRWSDRFRYVLVDEYQDTNAAQLELLRQIAGGHRNLCVVGDDDQAIYGWRGAEVRNILHFERHFPAAKVVYLQRNYRSVQSVLDLANAVISKNSERHAKVLKPTRGRGEPVRLVIAADGDGEAGWVAQRIREALGEGRSPREIAVLYRSNILSRTLEGELREHGISYRVLGGHAFYDRREVKDLIAYLRLCRNPLDEISLRRVINSPPRGIGPKTVAKLAAHAQQQQVPLFRALERAAEVLDSDPRGARAVEQFLALIGRFSRQLRARSWARSVEQLVETLDIEQSLRKTCRDAREHERRWANVQAFVAGLMRYAERRGDADLGTFLNRIALTSADEDARGREGDCVTLCTLHGAKGLEFPLVFVIGVEEGFLPHDRTLNPHANDVDGSDIAEERRLFYVGVTRARDELVLTRARTRAMHGKPRPRSPSRFLEDLPEQLLELRDMSQPPPVAQVKQMMAGLREMLEG